MRVRGLSMTLLLLALAAATAAPARAQSAEDREAEARELFAVGKYTEALDIYGKLYAKTSHPTYLRNIGRCYQNLGEPDKAISSFREYLRQAKNLTAEQRSVVDGYIQEMQELRRSGAAAPAGASAAPDGDEPPRPRAGRTRHAVRAGDQPGDAGAPGGELSAARSEGDPAARAETRRSSTSTGKIVGISLAVVGVAGIVVGALYVLDSRSKNDQARALCPGGSCGSQGEIDQHQNLVNDARSRQTIGIVGLVAGGAALAVGTVLAVTFWGGDRDPAPRVALWGTGRDAGIIFRSRW